MEAVKLKGNVVEINKGIKIVKITEENVETISDHVSSKSEIPILVNYVKVNKVYAFGSVYEDGDVIDSSESLDHYIKHLIPYEDLPKLEKRAYKCFAGIPTLRNNIIQHEDVGSSINCLMNILKHPKYVLIFS